MTAAVRLDDASVEAVAARVADLLRGEQVGAGLVDAGEIARRFGVSRDFIYSHSDDLGAVRLGDGPKARLRFDVERVREALSGEPDSVPQPTPSRRSRRRQSRPDLLPVRGRS